MKPVSGQHTSGHWFGDPGLQRLGHGKKLTVTTANSITTKGDERGGYNQFWLWLS